MMLVTIGVVLTYMTVLWAIAIRREEADIVDFGWASSVGLCAICFAVGLEGAVSQRLLIALIVSLWAARLSLYLLTTRVLRPGEDGRYKALRESWGALANRNFFIFFWAQGFLAFVLALPFYAICANPHPINSASWFEIGGALLFAVAFCGEAVADAQLHEFRSNPENKGKTCAIGLWRYSRHPNYFFEWLHWIAYALICLAAPLWYLAFLSPAIMLYLILCVTGIPPTEEHALRSRGAEYRAYQKRTNAFFPWFPKKMSL